MDKQKKERKVKLWCLRLFYVCSCLIVLYAFVFIIQFLFPYRNTTKIKNREEMFQFVIAHQEELEQIVKDMEAVYEKSDSRVIFISRNNSVEAVQLEIDSVNMLYKNFSADRVAARNSEDVFEVQFFSHMFPLDMITGGYTINQMIQCIFGV